MMEFVKIVIKNCTQKQANGQLNSSIQISQYNPNMTAQEALDIENSIYRAVDLYDNITNAYKRNWKLQVYSLDPTFHATIIALKEKYKAQRTYWQNIYRTPRQDYYDHARAVNEAIDIFDRA